MDDLEKAFFYHGKKIDFCNSRTQEIDLELQNVLKSLFSFTEHRGSSFGSKKERR